MRISIPVETARSLLDYLDDGLGGAALDEDAIARLTSWRERLRRAVFHHEDAKWLTVEEVET